jgi:O-antigen/teichoic acid export membrane protein
MSDRFRILMRKLEKVQIIKNVSSSWFALGINVLVGLFLWPVVLHRLGKEAAGVWVLIFSITGYYGLFDLGIRSSVIRYVSKAKATNDRESASRLINTSLFSYTCIGMLTFLITVVVSLYVDRFHSIRPEFQYTARWLLLMVGGAVSLGFPLGVSGGVLEGLQRFDVQNLTSVVTTLIRALLIVIALHHGYGLLMVAFITVALPLLSSIVRSVIAARMLPVPLAFGYVDRTTFREMASYGGTTLIVIVAARLRFRSDSIIIGAFLSAAAITYFNIGARIVDYAGEVVENLAQVFMPMSSHSDAQGNLDRLRKIFVGGNRFCAFTIFPICAILIVLGKSVIEAWVGAEYVDKSYPVLLILLVSTTLMLSQAASPRVLFGMSKHRTWAMVALTEGVVNIVLSMLLVRPYGIVGDAIGTAAPLAATTLCFLPWHLCRQLQIRMSMYLREAYLLPLIVCAPVVIVLLLMKQWFVPHDYVQLAAHLAVAGAVYGLSLLWAFASKRAMKIGNLNSPEAALEPPAAAGVAVENYSQEI